MNAPQGRWQKNKDIHWYQRDAQEEDPEIAAKKKREEIRKLREAEEDALSVALGFAPANRALDGDGGVGTGSNNIKVEKSEAEKEAEREEKRADKESVNPIPQIGRRESSLELTTVQIAQGETSIKAGREGIEKGRKGKVTEGEA